MSIFDSANAKAQMIGFGVLAVVALVLGFVLDWWLLIVAGICAVRCGMSWRTYRALVETPAAVDSP